MIEVLTIRKCSTVDPESNRQLLLFVASWPDDVKIKAVFRGFVERLIEL